MSYPPKRAGKKSAGMQGYQLVILVLLAVLLCSLFSAFISEVLSESRPLPTRIPTLKALPSNPATLTPSHTETPSPTSSPSFTPTYTPTETSSPIPTATEGMALPPDTTENIHVAQIFNGKVENPEDEKGVVDIVWGSKYPDLPEGVYNLYYYPFDRDGDAKSGGLHHDIDWFKANHPSWIEYTCDRKTPAYEFGSLNVPLDISNPAVIDYMMITYIIPAIQAGYEGIAFDNVYFGNIGHRCGVWRDGKWVAQSNYVENVLAWAKTIYSRVHAFNASVVMNFSFNLDRAEESNQIYQFMDFDLDERGFTNWGRRKAEYFTDDTWLANMQALQSLNSLGKGLISINQMPEDFNDVSQEEKQWALANYLLVKGQFSYIAIVGYQEYGVLFSSPEYSAPIGIALNDMYPSQGVYMRDFSNGLAIVNPSSSNTAIVGLSENIYQDLYGNAMKTITLLPKTGIVLLKR